MHAGGGSLLPCMTVGPPPMHAGGGSSSSHASSHLQGVKSLTQSLLLMSKVMTCLLLMISRPCAQRRAGPGSICCTICPFMWAAMAVAMHEIGGGQEGGPVGNAGQCRYLTLHVGGHGHSKLLLLLHEVMGGDMRNGGDTGQQCHVCGLGCCCWCCHCCGCMYACVGRGD